MIKEIHSMLLFVLLAPNLHGQKGEKVVKLFKTATEFSEARPSLLVDCNSKNKILLNGFFNKNYITVKEGDSTYNIFKNKVYGYQTCNKQVFRFLNKKELLLLNGSDEILLYRHQVPKPPTGRTNVTNYYFSIGAEGKVESLTFKNMKSTFKHNTAFLDLIDRTFKYNTDLAKYDDVHKIYIINLLLKNSRN